MTSAQRDLGSSRFPEPLRSALDHVERATEGPEDALLFELFDALGIFLRVTVAIGLSAARAAGVVAAPPAQATYGTLVSLCTTLGESLADQRLPVAGLGDFLASRASNGAVWDSIRGLVADRNRLVHASGPVELDPSSLLSSFADVLDRVTFLHGLRVDAVGPELSSIARLEEAGTGDKVTIEPRAKLLRGDDVLLDVDPFFVVVSTTRRKEVELGTFVITGAASSGSVWIDGAGRKITTPPPRETEAAPVVATKRSSSVESLDESLARAAAPLHRFVSLLKTALDADTLTHLGARFDAMGYAGSDEARLVEYCLERDLRDVLDELFSEPAIHRVAKSLELQTHPLEPRSSVATRVLHALKIPVPATPVGLSARRATVLRASARLAGVSDRASIRGTIGEACTTLERVLSDLVRFHGSIVLGPALQEALRERGWLQPHQTLGRASLGTLFEILGRIEALCLKAGTTEALRFAELFPGRQGLLGIDASERSVIARTRNAFSHVNDELDAFDVTRLRGVAAELFTSLASLFESLEELGVYPRVIAVREVVHDAFGRQFVRAVDEWGHEEKIFTDQKLEPGEAYFMHPLTNPVRIFPILVRVS